jgi:ABC-type antimicrobial peptide transport system permease subunit
MASIGLLGTLAFLAQERTRETVARVALGAAEADIVRLVLAQAVPWVVGGAVVGAGLSFAAAYLLRGILQGLTWVSVTYSLAGLAALTVAVGLACWWPGRRAAKLDPVACVAIRAQALRASAMADSGRRAVVTFCCEPCSPSDLISRPLSPA